MAVVRRVVLGSLIALLVAAGMPGSATPAAAADSPETVTVAAAADSSVLARSASSNLGSAASLTVDGSPVETSYLKFDLSALAGRTVTKAVLQVRSAGNASVGVQNVRLITDDSWTERGITYSNRPALGQAVGSLSAARSNTAHAIPLTTAPLQPELGHMLSLGLDSSSGDGLDLHSRETATPPQLVLTLSAAGAVTGTAPAPAPVASFTASAVSGPAPFAVAFTDTSTGSPTSWQWQFGDGGSSTQQNPTHTYHIAGYYLVTLVVSNGPGAPSTAAQSVTVEVPSPGPNRPTASFTASPESGSWPLRVSFTDTSTNSPTSWEWSFADGSTSTERNPTHTFATAASYPVRLVASNADGASEPVTRWIIVREPPTGGVIIVQESSSAVSLSSATVTVPRPAGLADGDVLIASINADDAPAMGAAPAGWEPVVNPLSMGTSARLFAYHRVVADASAEPSSYTWRLARAVKWNAAMTAYSGVDNGTPFDTAASTAVQTGRTTSLAVPGVTTVTPGALLVGGIGSNTAVMNINSASGWGETVKAGGGQVTSLAYQTRSTVGDTGTARWSINPAEQAAGWIRGLRPAAG